MPADINPSLVLPPLNFSSSPFTAPNIGEISSGSGPINFGGSSTSWLPWVVLGIIVLFIIKKGFK